MTAGWIFNTTYTYGIVHEKLMDTITDRVPPMPFVLIESIYEGEHNASEVQIRRQAYWAVLAGATGQFMGNKTHLALRFRAGKRPSILKARRTWPGSMRCRFTAVARFGPGEKHEVVIDGLGEFRGLDYLSAARTADGGTVIAYLPDAGRLRWI